LREEQQGQMSACAKSKEHSRNEFRAAHPSHAALHDMVEAPAEENVT
jgi:hypothetical protein